MIPKERSKKIVELAKKKILLYGGPKIGKSTFLSRMDGCLIIATEPGLDDLESLRWQADDGRYVVRDWTELKVALGEAVADPAVKSIAIDTMDEAVFLCQRHVCEGAKVEHYNDGALGYGKGRDIIVNELRKFLVWAASQDKGLILTSHSLATEIEDGAGGKVTKIVPNIPEKIRQLVLGFMDIILYAEVAKRMSDKKMVDVRILHAAPGKLYEAGDRTGRLPEELPLSYAAFSDAYNKEVSK